MQEQEIKEEITSFVSSQGMAIHGVAAARQLPSIPKRFSPGAVLKGAKSVICYGLPIPKELLCAESNSLGLYWRYCSMQYRMLDSASNRLCLILEKTNCSALPIYSCFPWKVVNREFWGHLPLVYWAEEAGLGRLAKCGLLITPRYGTRILLGGVITTHEVEPSDKLDEDICPSDCFDCINACPAKAIARTGKVDHNLCVRYSTANPLLALALNNRETRNKYSFETLLNTMAIDDHATYLCIECLKACPLNSR